MTQETDMRWNDFWSRFGREAYDEINVLEEYAKMTDKAAEWAGKDRRVLDAGCGTGNLARKLGRNNKVTAIDYSPGMLEKAAEKTAGNENVELLQASVLSLPFADESYDVVVSVNVLFNLSDPARAIREAYRVLGKNGVLIVSSLLGHQGPTEDVIQQAAAYCKRTGVALDGLARVLRYQNILRSGNGFNYVPEEKEVIELIESCGFSILERQRVYFGNNCMIKAAKRPMNRMTQNHTECQWAAA